MTEIAEVLEPTGMSRTRLGLLLGLGTALVWGMVPAYFMWLHEVPAQEILAQRIVWSMAILLVMVPAMGELGALWRAFATPRVLATLTLTAGLIAVNWLAFIYCVQNGHIVDAGLGFYIWPLTNVLLGRMILGERLGRWQVVSCWLAAASVTWFGWNVGAGVGWALFLGITFGLYSLLRKVVEADATVGLAVECILMAPFALGYLVYLTMAGTLHFHAATPGITLLLLGTGAITALPLVAYAAAARMMRLSSLGVLMYLYPSIQVLVGVAAYGEAFDTGRLVAFIGIWTSLALYAVGSRHPQGVSASA